MGLNTHYREEGRQANTLHGLTNTLAVLTNFHPPIPNLLNKINQFLEIRYLWTF